MESYLNSNDYIPETTAEIPSFIDQLPVDKAAKLVIEVIGPRVYKLEGFLNENKINFFVIGCQGDGINSPQEEVAALMNANALQERPDFILVLGDNVYDYGVLSPLDEDFDKCFNAIYGDEKLAGLDNIPFFLILGNHDSNRSRTAFLRYHRPQGKPAEANEVAYNYVPSTKYTKVSQLKKMFEKDTLTLSSLQQWNMPYYFYSLIAGDLQIFCLNSNSYAKDFLDAELDATSNAINQAVWFKEEYEKAKESGKKILVAMHHPLYCQTKRAYPPGFDTGLYLSNQQLTALNAELGTDTKSYNELLAFIFAKQEIDPDILFVAHDHSMSYVNSKSKDPANVPAKLVNSLPHDPDCMALHQSLTQIGAGGGGSHSLQKRQAFTGETYTGCYLKNYGFVKISTALKDGKDIIIEFLTTDDQHLKFSYLSHTPLRDIELDAVTKNFCEIVARAAHEYLFYQGKHINYEEDEFEEENTQDNLIEQDGFGYFQFFTNTASSYLQTVGNAALGAISSVANNVAHIKNNFYHGNKPEDVDWVHTILACVNQPAPDINTLLEQVNDYLNKLEDNYSAHSFKKILEKKFIERADYQNSDVLLTALIPAEQNGFEL